MSKTSTTTTVQLSAEQIAEIANRVAEILSAKNATTGITVKNGKGKKAPELKVQKSTKTIADFEPKKGSDGNYIWASYKAQRTHYCYFVATKGNCDKNPFGTEWEGKISYEDGSPYKKAKAAFEKKFHYVKLSDR